MSVYNLSLPFGGFLTTYEEAVTANEMLEVDICKLETFKNLSCISYGQNNVVKL